MIWIWITISRICLEDIDKIPGEYLIRFMSSHPKDATNHLFDVMAKCSHVAKQLHLPFQSGNDRVLKEMNRRYTRETVPGGNSTTPKSVMPGLVLTSDVIIGFPGETEAEAMDTVSLVEEVGFDALFTFIYSPRPGTKAAAMPDPATRAEKQKWFDKLLEVQNANSAKLHAAYVGKTVRVLVDGESDDENFPLASRTEGNRLVRLKGDKSLIGQLYRRKGDGQQHLGAVRRAGVMCCSHMRPEFPVELYRFGTEKPRGYSLLKRECPPGPLKRNAGGFRFPPAPP